MLNLCVWLWAGLSVSYENPSVIGAHLQRVATSCCHYSLRFVFMSRVVNSINAGCQTKMLNAISREAGYACALRSTYIEVCTAALIVWAIASFAGALAVRAILEFFRTKRLRFHIGIVGRLRCNQRASFGIESDHKPGRSRMGGRHGNKFGAVLDRELMIDMVQVKLDGAFR